MKPYLSISEQVALLAERGLQLDKDLASQWLTNVGYYRLSAYWHPYRVPYTKFSTHENFIPGADFADVVALYEFDRKLRTLVHDGIERVEIMLRSHLCELLGASNPMSYIEASSFRHTFQHSAWLSMAQGVLPAPVAEVTLSLIMTLITVAVYLYGR
ncbi:Abi family protein [Leucobacter sp. HY1910]